MLASHLQSTRALSMAYLPPPPTHTHTKSREKFFLRMIPVTAFALSCEILQNPCRETFVVKGCSFVGNTPKQLVTWKTELSSGPTEAM